MKTLWLIVMLAFAAPALAEDAAVSPADRAQTEAQAKAGDAEAAFMLARMYRDGVGGPEDKSEARIWLKRAADAGHARASALLGLMLMSGEGGAPDRDAARPMLLFAAASGEGAALYGLGVLFAEGTVREGGGPEQNASAAAFWFRLAAEAGNIDGMYNLALMNLQGIGTPKNEAAAYEWFVKAAEAGEPQAVMVVARMLADGKGVQADPKMALVWLLRGKAQGAKDDALENELLNRLSEAEVAEARRLAGS
jgi:TPR repeat protein